MHVDGLILIYIKKAKAMPSGSFWRKSPNNAKALCHLIAHDFVAMHKNGLLLMNRKMNCTLFVRGPGAGGAGLRAD